MSYQRTNWKGVPESNAIYKGLMNLEDGMTMHESLVSGSKISVSLETKKLHGGLEITPIVTPNTSDVYMLYPSEYGWLRTSDNKYKNIISGVFPAKYKGKTRHYILATMGSDSLFELTFDNAAIKQRDTAAENKEVFRYYLNYGAGSSFTPGQYTMFRYYVELLDSDRSNENAAVIKRLYSSQIVYHNNDGTIECTEMRYPSDPDCIVSAYYCKSSANEIPGDQLDDDDVYREPIVNGGIGYEWWQDQGTPGKLRMKRVLPWSLCDPSCQILNAIFVYGDGKILASNGVSFVPPDMVAKAAITSGQTFLLDGLWYKATANIGSGETVVLGTNAVACEMPVF